MVEMVLEWRLFNKRANKSKYWCFFIVLKLSKST